MALTDAVTSATVATGAVAGAAAAVSNSGPASAIGSIAGSLSKVLGTIGGFFSSSGGVQLPIANPLFKYASYDYVITLVCLTATEATSPYESYVKNKVSGQIIAASANMNPTNRVKTPYGTFDFYINNLKIKSVMGFMDGNSTRPTVLTFDIIEPYSFGMFPIAMQVAGVRAKFENWRDAPYLLKIEFRGNTETGSMGIVPKSTRWIPFKFSRFNAKTSAAGTVYSCRGYVTNAEALSDQINKVRTDISATGKTIQEVLQTGEQSVQKVINDSLRQLETAKQVGKADQILIIFPVNQSTGPASGTPGATETTSSATTNPQSGADSDPATAALEKIGVTVTGAEEKLNYQQITEVNWIGTTEMGWGGTKTPDTPIGKDNVVYDRDGKIMRKDLNAFSITDGVIKFSQKTSIVNIIDQVMLSSEFPKQVLPAEAVDEKGFRKWWSVETQTYPIETTANDKNTGKKPLLIVYRVVPYEVHASQGAPVNTTTKGLTELKKTIVKEYNYIYTGKNVDILKFDIDFNVGWSTVLLAGGSNRSQDIDLNRKESAQAADPKSVQGPVNGQAAGKQASTIPTQLSYSANTTKTSQLGGAKDDAVSIAARQLDDILKKGYDMMRLNLEIIGDPYWIGHSGLGNYNAVPTEVRNLNADGSVNHQRGEVIIQVNFGTPTDINQSTGLYAMTKSSAIAPVGGFTGQYKVTIVESKFGDGKFTQTLTGYRLMNGSEATKRPANLLDLFNINKPAPPDPASSVSDTPPKTDTSGSSGEQVTP